MHDIALYKFPISIYLSTYWDHSDWLSESHWVCTEP